MSTPLPPTMGRVWCEGPCGASISCSSHHGEGVGLNYQVPPG